VLPKHLTALQNDTPVCVINTGIGYNRPMTADAVVLAGRPAAAYLLYIHHAAALIYVLRHQTIPNDHVTK